MNTRSGIKLVREGEYAADVPVQFIEDETGWSPYLSPEDAFKLDDMRKALRTADLERAAQLGRVFRLEPLALPGP